MKVRMFKGTYEDNAQTIVFPVAFPLREMTDYENTDVDDPAHIDLHDEAALERWATAAFGEDWGIWDMEVPEGALVYDGVPDAGCDDGRTLSDSDASAGPPRVPSPTQSEGDKQ